MNLFFSLLPIIILIYLMVRRNSMASHHALPFCAVLLYIIKAAWFVHCMHFNNSKSGRTFIVYFNDLILFIQLNN